MKITGGLLATLGVLVLLVALSDKTGGDVRRAAVAIVGALFAVGGLLVVSLQQIREALAGKGLAAQESTRP